MYAGFRHIQDGFFDTINSYPVSYMDNGVAIATSYFGNVRGFEGIPGMPQVKALVGIVSKEYNIIQNATVRDAVLRSSPSGVSLIAAGNFGGKSLQRYDFPFPQAKNAFGKGDAVGVSLDIINSFNATSSLIFNPYLLRLVCTNGMRSRKCLTSLRLVHKKKLEVTEAIGGAVSTVIKTIRGFIGRIVELKDVSAKDVDTHSLLRLTAEGLSKTLADRIEAHLDLEKMETKFDIYNAFTYELSRYARIRGLRRIYHEMAVSELFGV